MFESKCEVSLREKKDRQNSNFIFFWKVFHEDLFRLLCFWMHQYLT